MGPAIGERIDHLQRKKQEIAVVHADGHPRGLVTSTNAFDAIAGELEEPVAPSSPRRPPVALHFRRVVS